jgi:pyruvate dehydrogenase E1 component alpha subunit
VGALSTRHETDLVMPSYRCHGYPIVLGTPLRTMMAEVFGRKDGLCGGFGGSMHLADPSRYFPGTSGIIGQSIAHATGAALTAQVKKTGHIVYCFFGDGASKQGAFFESLNMAAVWKLPVVYVLENNQYQAYTHFSLEDANAVAGHPLSKKAEAFSIPGVTVDGTDPISVREAVGQAAERARAGGGPSLVNEYEEWKAKDPIPRFRAKLVNDDILSGEDAGRIEEEARHEVEDAVAFALASPFPAAEDAVRYVYA